VRTRVALGALGVVVAAYGAHRLLTRQDPDAWIEVGAWLVVGVLLHDGLLAPLCVAAGALLVRLVPGVARPPAAVGLVVLGSVTLMAVPVLGRFGARPDNPTLLDRPYGPGWLGLLALVAVGVGLGTLVRVRRQASRGGVDGASARR
jgi:hypothetical protein